MLIQLARHMGTILGVSATSSVTQASLKILLHERFKGPDAEQVSKCCVLYMTYIFWLTSLL